MSGSDFGSPPSTALRTSFAPSAGSASPTSEVCRALSNSQQEWQMHGLTEACNSQDPHASSSLLGRPATMTCPGGSQDMVAGVLMTVQEEGRIQSPSGSDDRQPQRSLSGASASAVRQDDRRPSLLNASSSLAGLTIPEVPPPYSLSLQMLAGPRGGPGFGPVRTWLRALAHSDARALVPSMTI